MPVHLLNTSFRCVSGTRNWKGIAAEVGTRNHVQCRQRWQKVLKPGLRKGQWSAEEDAALQAAMGSSDPTAKIKWTTIAKGISGRTTKQCRERWLFYLSPHVT